MSIRPLLLVCALGLALSACASGAALIETSTLEEFTLTPGQSAWVADAGLTITFHSVVSDDRCPSEVECVASGPVTVSLTIQQETDEPAGFTLQTFTNADGRAAEGKFEGITNRADVGEYQIQLLGVSPYPRVPEPQPDPSAYQITLFVSSP